ncbi:hypothetical protein [Kribbella sp. NPDC004536]|uniref:hypothetical protein n=1 Tax=Kribbella sp. NPDC004536 TaxID=3364106 RepID=UPI003680BE11
MTDWEHLRVDLLRYGKEAPGALVVGPSPHTERRYETRFQIKLAAWAVDIAGDLQRKYGELVELQVGALTFPAKQPAWDVRRLQLPGEPAQSVGLTVTPLAPLTIRSGYHAMQDVLVTNHARREQVLLTAGDLRSEVVDESGQTVGRYVGPHNLPRVEFPIDPHQSRQVPVLIGTASVVPELGYAVPPGRWGLQVSLQTEAGFYLSEPLELVIL